MTKEMLIANAGLKVAAPQWVDLQFELICAARDTMAAGDMGKALQMLHFAATVVAHPDFFGDEMIEQLYDGLRAQA